MGSASFSPSGRQYEISSGPIRLVATEVGASIRRLDVDGIAILEPFAVDALSDGAHGALLAPWPNRIPTGRYAFGGRECQLDLSDPSHGAAIHGLLRWQPFACSLHVTDAVTLEHLLWPSPGYPFALQLAVTYSLDEAGLRVRVEVHNLGMETCPFALGHHPYVAAGEDAHVDDLLIRVPGLEFATMDARGELVGWQEVDGSAYDFRSGRIVGDQVLDGVLRGGIRGSDGRLRVDVRRPDEREVTLWMDEHFDYVQLFSGDTLAPDRRRRGLAIEPMTAPPGAFRSGEGVQLVAPKEKVVMEWGIELRSR
ncbi:MAG: aldose 1-epimerase family protein [Acidimicrobiales bacterium]